MAVAPFIFNADNVSMDSRWTVYVDMLGGVAYYSMSTPGTDYSHVEFDLSDLPRNFVIDSAIFTYSLNSPWTGAAIKMIEGETLDGSYNATADVKALAGNYSDPLELSTKFKANGTKNTTAGSHTSTLTLSNCKLTVTGHYNESTGAFVSASRNAGDSATLNITPASSDAQHKVIWSMGSSTPVNSGLLAAGVTQHTLNPIPMDWLTNIPNTMSGAANCRLETYQGGVRTGYKDYTLTVKCPSYVVPGFTLPDPVHTPFNSTVADWGYIQGKSKASLQITNEVPAYGSPITYRNISGGGFAANAAVLNTGYIQQTGTVTFTAEIRDARGQSKALTKSVTVKPYTKPSFTVLRADRCDSLGAIKVDGTNAWVQCSFTCQSISGGANTVTARVKYREHGTAGAYLGDRAVTSGVAFKLGTDDMAIDAEYDLVFTATDALDTKETVFSLDVAQVTLHLKNGGKSVGILTMGGEDGTIPLGGVLVAQTGEKIGVPSNSNLLINAEYFPVWQRGTSFSSGNGYTADRWFWNGGTAPVVKTTYSNTTALRFTPASVWRSIWQYIEFPSVLSGKQVTISTKYYGANCYLAMQLNGINIFSVSDDDATGIHIMSATFTLPVFLDSDKVSVLFGNKTTYGNPITVSYIKLEVGPVATPISPRIYEEELARCQRFLLPIGYTRLRADRKTNDLIDFAVQTPTPMRGTPAPTIVGTPVVYAYGGAAQSGFSLAVSVISPLAVTIRATKTAHGLADATLDIDYNCFLDNEMYP